MLLNCNLGGFYSPSLYISSIIAQIYIYHHYIYIYIYNHCPIIHSSIQDNWDISPFFRETIFDPPHDQYIQEIQKKVVFPLGTAKVWQGIFLGLLWPCLGGSAGKTSPRCVWAWLMVLNPMDSVVRMVDNT